MRPLPRHDDTQPGFVSRDYRIERAEVAERLVGEGFLSYDDLSVIEPEDLMEMGELSAEVVDAIVMDCADTAPDATKSIAASA